MTRRRDLDTRRPHALRVLLHAVLVAAVTATAAGCSPAATGDASAGTVEVDSRGPVADATDPPVERHVPAGPDADAAHRTSPVTMVRSAPVRLEIPVIGVDSELMALGLQADGSLEVPPTGFPAGWYTGGPTPGELGPAVVAGHVDWGGRPGVFFPLRDLTPGDEVVITRQDGGTARFHITQVRRFAKDEFPTQMVYGDIDHAGLRLITCGGVFDRQFRSYEDNLVVFARLAGVDGYGRSGLVTAG